MDSINPFTPTTAESSQPVPWQGAPGTQPAYVSTTGLTVVTLLFVIFGILGVLVALGGTVGYFLAGSIEGFANPQKSSVVSEMQRVQRMFLLPGFILTCINGLISLGLILSGVGLASYKRWGARLGSRFSVAGMGFEVVRLVFTVIQQAAVISLLMRQFSGITDSMEGAEQTQYWGMVIGSAIGILFGIGYSVGKFLMYYFCRRYLNKPTTESLLS